MGSVVLESSAVSITFVHGYVVQPESRLTPMSSTSGPRRNPPLYLVHLNISAEETRILLILDN